MGAKLDSVIKEVNKEAKEEIMSVGLIDYNYKRIPFTSPMMNYCTYGGLPIGKLIEFYGAFSSGKTTTALDIIANYQRLEEARDVLYIDAENTLDAEWAKKLGVDVDKLVILQPKEQSAEQLFDIIIKAVSTGEVGLWVLDSIGVLQSDLEMSKGIGEATYGGISKPLTRFSKEIVSMNAKYKCTGIAINQERAVLNTQFPTKTTVGGNGFKHNCSIRIEFNKGNYIDEKGNPLSSNCENPAGNIVQAKITKIKTAPPDRRIGSYMLNYTYGVDYVKDLVNLAIKFNIVLKSGAWFDIINTDTGEVIESKIHGIASVYKYLEDNQDCLDIVDRLVNEKISPSIKKADEKV